MENTVIYDAIAGVDAKAEYNGEGINALQQDTAALLAKGAVKSVQRGTYQGDNLDYHDNISIPINPVNLSKSVLSIFDSGSSNSGLSNSIGASNTTYTFESNQIKLNVLGTKTYSNPVLFWQVIEFY